MALNFVNIFSSSLKLMGDLILIDEKSWRANYVLDNGKYQISREGNNRSKLKG